MLGLGLSTLLLSFLSSQTQAVPLSYSLSFLQPRAAPICNGNTANCNKKYSEVTFVGTHDSPFVGELPTQNQEKSVTDQLNGGIRFMSSQVHTFLNTLTMCHTKCELEDGGTVQNYLQEVKAWMDKNPTEVLTLLLTNGDRNPVTQFDTVFKAVGLDSYAFVPSSSPNPLPLSSWPTLGAIIAGGKRLIVFMGAYLLNFSPRHMLTPSTDYNANTKQVPYIMDEFSYFFETPFDTTDKTFNECKIDRQNNVNPDGKSSMYIVNHFLDLSIFGILIPDMVDAAKTNAVTGSGSIGAQASLCKGIYGRNPNVVLIDYFGRGAAMAAQTSLNQ
jgi:hypothetical protein